MRIHSLGYVYGDLKPENIMTDPKTFKIKFIDFGSVFKTGTKDNILFQTFSYLPPEAFLKLNQTAKTDMWSLGILLIEIITINDIRKPTNLLVG
jgi:serine/threonine protein kinase